jgi:Ca2+-binding RTX toxin-like protein
MLGGSGDDRLYGGTGTNTLFGGTGDDIFGVDARGSNNIIADFGGDDAIIIKSSDGLDFGDLTLSQNQSDAIISAGDLRIRLENYDVDDLEADDFSFF